MLAGTPTRVLCSCDSAGEFGDGKSNASVSLTIVIVAGLVAQPVVAQTGRAAARGAMGGALIGGLAGGRRGAAMGALVGAGTGAAIARYGWHSRGRYYW